MLSESKYGIIIDIYLLKISDTEAINIGSENLRSIKAKYTWTKDSASSSAVYCAVLLEMSTNQCGKCPKPVYEYTYEICLDGIEKKNIDQEAYDRLCDMVNCIENKL